MYGNSSEQTKQSVGGVYSFEWWGFTHFILGTCLLGGTKLCGKQVELRKKDVSNQVEGHPLDNPAEALCGQKDP